MALVSKRLFTCSLRSKLTTKVFVQPYHCYILTRPNYKQKYVAENFSVLRVNVNTNCYSLYDPLRQYSSSSGGDRVRQKDEKKEQQKLSLFQRFKQMYRDYWYVLVPVHLVTSAAWFGGFYYLAVSGVDIPGMLECLNFSEKIVNSMRNSSMGYFAITYGLYKIATPVRYTVTLGGTTVAINYLKKWGHIKPMPSKERLKEIYVETKEGMKEKRENLMESVQNLQQTVKGTKDGIKETKDNIVSSVKESKDSIKNIKQKVMGSSEPKHEDKR